MSLLGLNTGSENLQHGIAQAELNGRFQILDKGYTLVLDVAHNPHAAEHLSKNIERYFPDKSIHIVVAMLADKEIEKNIT